MHKPNTRRPSYSQTSAQKRFNVTSSAAGHAERSGRNTSKPSMPGAPDMNAWLPRPRLLPKSSSTQVDWSSDGWRTATQHRRRSMLNERRRADAEVIAERGEEGQECHSVYAQRARGMATMQAYAPQDNIAADVCEPQRCAARAHSAFAARGSGHQTREADANGSRFALALLMSKGDIVGCYRCSCRRHPGAQEQRRIGRTATAW